MLIILISRQRKSSELFPYTTLFRSEAAFDQPWAMDLPEDYLRKMIRGIVAFEMPITRLEGKFKLSQNRSARDQQRSEEHTSELQSRRDLVCRLLLEKKNNKQSTNKT